MFPRPWISRGHGRRQASRLKLCVEELTSRENQASIPEAGNSHHTRRIWWNSLKLKSSFRRRRLNSRSVGQYSRLSDDGNSPANSCHLCRIGAASGPVTGIFRVNSRYFALKREFSGRPVRSQLHPPPRSPAKALPEGQSDRRIWSVRLRRPLPHDRCGPRLSALP